MIDGSLLAIIPPLVATVLTYVISNKRAKIIHAKNITDVQMTAIEHVRASEEKMRNEIWNELTEVRKQNDILRDDIRDYKDDLDNFKKKLINSEELVSMLRTQIASMNQLLDGYKNRILELEKSK